MVDPIMAEERCSTHKVALVLLECRSCGGDGEIECQDDCSDEVIGYMRCCSCNGRGQMMDCEKCAEELEA